MKNNIVTILNSISIILGVLLLGYYFLASWAVGFNTTGGRVASGRDITVLALIVIVTIVCVVLSRTLPNHKTFIAAIPVVVIVGGIFVMYATSFIAKKNTTQQNQIQTQSLSKDFMQKDYYVNNEFNLEGTDTYISVDTARNMLVKVYIDNNTTVLEFFDIATIDGQQAKLFDEFETAEDIQELKGYVNKKGVSVVDVYHLRIINKF